MRVVDRRHQSIAFSGVGAYGQNGVVERSIQTIISSARTMLLRQALHWPAQFDMRLWPFSLEHAIYLWNYLSNGDYKLQGGLSPINIYTSSKLDTGSLRVEKPCGCPEYALDPRLRDGRKISKWSVHGLTS